MPTKKPIEERPRTDGEKTKLEDFEQSRPPQLESFELRAPDDRRYSNTIELYDAIPRFFYANQEKLRIKGKFLDSITRQFDHKSAKYEVTISPARIVEPGGREREYFPSQREELIEDALRKLACDGKGLFLDDIAGLTFTLYELQKELERNGHGYNINEIKLGLSILQKTKIDIRTVDGTASFSFGLIETLGLRTQADLKTKKGSGSKGFVRFNSLVSRSILEGTFRQLDYERVMTYRRVLPRWLHKRLSHNYVQASRINCYTITLERIINDSGMTRYAKLADNLYQVIEALEEMKQRGTLADFKTTRIFDPTSKRKKLIGAKFELYASDAFIADAIKANVRSKETAERIRRLPRRDGGAANPPSLPFDAMN